jgi:hypothetical protein
LSRRRKVGLRGGEGCNSNGEGMGQRTKKERMREKKMRKGVRLRKGKTGRETCRE